MPFILPRLRALPLPPRSALLAAALLPVLLWSVVTDAQPPEPAVRPDLALSAAQIVELGNDQRRRAGLARLEADGQLTAAAQDLALYMARSERFGHEADGRTPVERAQARGYAHCLVLENIAWRHDSRGFSSDALAAGLVRGWMDSPGHRRNLLDRDALEIGIGLAQGERSGRFYAVQLFGRPASSQTRFAISNGTPRLLSYELGGRVYTLAPRVTRDHRQCRAGELSLQVPGRPEPARMEPRDGAHYRVEARRDGSIELVRQ